MAARQPGGQREYEARGQVEGGQFPAHALERALWWEQHLRDLTAPDDLGQGPRKSGSLAAREALKAAELTALTGMPVSAATVKRLRLRYRREGLAGLLDGRSLKARSPYGRTDPRIVEALRALIGEDDGALPSQRELADAVRTQLDANGEGEVALPSLATLGRLVRTLLAERGRVGWGRGSMPPQHPGHLVVGIASVEMDMAARDAAGGMRRVEMTVAVELATRSIVTARVHPSGLEPFDHAALLRHVLTSPVLTASHGGDEDRANSASSTGDRLIVVPGRIELERAGEEDEQHFLRACARLGISVVASVRQGGAHKVAHEAARKFAAVAVQANRARSDPRAANGAVTFTYLQHLLDAWSRRVWQRSPHPELATSDLTTLRLSPEKALARRNQALVPIALTTQELIAMLPRREREVLDSSVRLNGLSYRHPALTAWRGERREVRFDPFSPAYIWIRSGELGYLKLSLLTGSDPRPAGELMPIVSTPFRYVSAASPRAGSAIGARAGELQEWPALAGEAEPEPGPYDRNILETLDERTARIAYHLTRRLWPTPLLEQVHAWSKRTNAPEVTGRRELVVSGPPGTGKTLAVLDYARFYTHDHASDSVAAPAVYLRLYQHVSARGMTAQIAHEHQISLARRHSAHTASQVLCEQLAARGCRLLVFDDAHHANDTVVSVMRYMADTLGAALVVAGINVHSTSFRPDPPERGTGPRNTVIRAGNMGYQSAAERAAWLTVVTAAEHDLRLHAHKQGTLPEIAKYLHERTDGNIAHLAYLISSAARHAIEESTERITRGALEAVSGSRQ